MANATNSNSSSSSDDSDLSFEESLDPTTHFAFQHKIFAVPGARFAPSRMDGEPMLRVLVGELEASIPLDQVAAEFQIDPESSDGKLLETVRRSLRYVKDIRPGDTIPRELLDGTASWSIDEKHRVRARARLFAVIDAWFNNRELSPVELRSVGAIEPKPEEHEKALEKLGRSAKLRTGDPQEVIDLINRVARELAYIEALRDRYAMAHAIQPKLLEVMRVNREDRQYTAEIQRIKALMIPPIKDFNIHFEQTNAEIAEVVRVIRAFDKTVIFLREMRDELHAKLMIWDEILDEWDDEPGHKSKAMRQLIQQTYRFVARHFPQTQDWS